MLCGRFVLYSIRQSSISTCASSRLSNCSTARNSSRNRPLNEERASVAVASNAPFSEWGRTFTDARLAAAVVDRLTFRAHIIETGSDSYRLRVTAATKGGASTS